MGKTEKTVGPFLIAAGLLAMGRIGPGSAYLTDILLAVLIFGFGLWSTSRRGPRPCSPQGCWPWP